MNLTTASTGYRRDARGVARICAWTLIAALAITLAGCCVIEALILPLIVPDRIELGPESWRALAECLWPLWLVDLIILLLF